MRDLYLNMGQVDRFSNEWIRPIKLYQSRTIFLPPVITRLVQLSRENARGEPCDEGEIECGLPERVG